MKFVLLFLALALIGSDFYLMGGARRQEFWRSTRPFFLIVALSAAGVLALIWLGYSGLTLHL